MNQHSYDVLTEPWIPVLRQDGTAEELGLLPCLKQAHQLREVRDPSPMIEFGIYRLLVAFVLDALILADRRPEDTEDLKDLLEEGAFDAQQLDAYVKACGEVFDLFHPKRPFLQTAMDGGKLKPLAGLYAVVPSGTNASHWHHGYEHEFAVSPARALRLLTTIAPFMTAGGSGLSPSINGAPAVYTLPLGKTLFDTILLNLPLREQDRGDGRVAWCNTRKPSGERTEATAVEALTWRPRSVQLIPTIEEGGQLTVQEMRFGVGDKAALPWIDSNLAYGYGSDKVNPVRMQANRPLWRDVGPLLFLEQATSAAGKERRFRRPDVVQQAFEVCSVETSLPIHAYGMRTDMKMKVFEWARARWVVPVSLGRSTRLGAVVHRELDRAGGVARSMRQAIRSLHPSTDDKKVSALGSVASRCERAYWQALEAEFHPLMEAFSKLNENAPDDPACIAATAEPWRKAIEHLAIEHFELAAKDMDSDAEAMKRLVKARGRLHKAIRRILHDDNNGSK